MSLSRLRETLDQRAEVGTVPVTRRLRVREGTVNVRRVSFAGKDGSPVLDRVTLQASRGELVAVVGPTGSGKSTLVDLLLRFKEPTAGRIVIDGRRTANVALASLRANVGWVPQEAVLFDGSLRENIVYGSRRPPGADHVQEAVQRAGLGDLVQRLPGGLDGRIGGGGHALSNGERQRIALARALVADPPILVLDDLALGTDAEASAGLVSLLRSLADEKTVIVTTSQPAIMRAADRIYVLRRGRLVEQGTHDELMEQGVTYPHLVGLTRGAEPGPATHDIERPGEAVPAEPSAIAG